MTKMTYTYESIFSKGTDHILICKNKPGIAIGEAISGVLGKLQPRFCVFGQVGAGSSEFEHCKAAKNMLPQNVTDCSTLLPAHGA